MNILLKWNNPTDQQELNSLRIYRAEVSHLDPGSLSCKTAFYAGELIHEQTEGFAAPGEEESYIDENVGDGVWCYSVLGNFSWGHGACDLGTFTVGSGSGGSGGSTGSTGSPTGADTTWESIGITPPNSNILPGTTAFGTGDGPVSDQGETSVMDGSSGCSNAINGALKAKFYYDQPTTDPCSIHSLGTGPYQDFALDTWYHLALTRQGSTAVLYVNGMPTAVATNMQEGPAFQNIAQVGALYSSSYKNDWCWNGLLDQSATWARALSPNDILELYNGGDGVPYDQMSEGLKNGITHAIECTGPASYSLSDTYGTDVTQNSPVGWHTDLNIQNKVDGSTPKINIKSGSGENPLVMDAGNSGANSWGAYTIARLSGVGSGKPMELTINEGKVSSWSFAPCRDDILRDASGATKGEAIASTYKARAAITIQGPLGAVVPWASRDPGSDPIYWTTSIWLKKYGEARGYAVARKINSGEEAWGASGAIFADYQYFSGSNREANLLATDRGNRDPNYALWNLS